MIHLTKTLQPVTTLLLTLATNIEPKDSDGGDHGGGGGRGNIAPCHHSDDGATSVSALTRLRSECSVSSVHQCLAACTLAPSLYNSAELEPECEDSERPLASLSLTGGCRVSSLHQLQS